MVTGLGERLLLGILTDIDKYYESIWVYTILLSSRTSITFKLTILPLTTRDSGHHRLLNQTQEAHHDG
jgi:hypothetical protein